MSRLVRIATRTSQLALWQAEEVKRRLLGVDDTLRVELVPIKSDGDMAQEKGFDQFGYKGVFTKRIEAALLDGRADIAVHSMKDVHSDLPGTLTIAAMLKREDPRDAFISERYDSLEALPQGARLGTASVRRQAIIRHLRPDLELVPFRGNVPTRLRKLQQGEVDATLLAVAGLRRLELQQYITALLPTGVMLPAVAQGAIGIEARRDNTALLDLLAQINHAPTFCCVSAERALLGVVDGDCHTPLSGLATLEGDTLSLSARWYGAQAMCEVTETGPASDAEALGRRAGAALKAKIDAP